MISSQHPSLDKYCGAKSSESGSLRLDWRIFVTAPPVTHCMEQGPFCGTAPKKSEKKLWHNVGRSGRYSKYRVNPIQSALYQCIMIALIKCDGDALQTSRIMIDIRYTAPSRGRKRNRTWACNTPDAWFLIVQAHVDGHCVSVKFCPVRVRPIR
jgi:hypothetical protein